MDVSKLYQVRLSQTNRVSQSVSFLKVADWIAQGRVTGADGVRAIGQSHWTLIQDEPEFAVYLPRRAEVSVDDAAEALEPVELGFSTHRRHDSEDDDPDMIPLIDISLVLLVFFMLTAAEVVAVSPVDTPPAEHARVIKQHASLNVNVDFQNSQPIFFLDGANQPRFAAAELDAFVNYVAGQIPSGGVETTIVKAHSRVPYSTIQALIAGLDSKGLDHIEAGVRDLKPSKR